MVGGLRGKAQDDVEAGHLVQNSFFLQNDPRISMFPRDEIADTPTPWVREKLGGGGAEGEGEHEQSGSASSPASASCGRTARRPQEAGAEAQPGPWLTAPPPQASSTSC